jgi:hypothetical protein
VHVVTAAWYAEKLAVSTRAGSPSIGNLGSPTYMAKEPFQVTEAQDHDDRLGILDAREHHR